MPGFSKKLGGTVRAIDTNMLVRYLTGDHPQQSTSARSVIDSGPVFASNTVLLESEWVLRSVYGFERKDVATSLRAFVGLPSVFVENADLLVEAFDRADGGLDFADALHLGAAAHCEAMVTFDRRFVEFAKNATPRVTRP